jgi:UDP-2,3-diacylglucosamine hydrolase
VTRTDSLPRFAELQAPGSWCAVEFISDLHLQAEEPATFEAWRRYMAAASADALFILGDLFEVWVGDDAAHMPGFANDCAAVIHATSRRMPVFVMHGNRDFLLGDGMVRACGATLLEDPTVFGFLGQRWLLTHGDLLSPSDTDYLRFREQVREVGWQRQFLGKPLHERQAIGRHMRAESEARQAAGGTVEYAPVDDGLVRRWLAAADATTMIHGHTHLPADHPLGNGRSRIVLSDWDALAQPPRLESLRLDASGAHRLAFR